MKTLKNTSWRGWDVHIYEENGIIGGEYKNEHCRYVIESDLEFADAEDAFTHIQECINVHDWNAPNQRTASFRDINPDPMPLYGYGADQ